MRPLAGVLFVFGLACLVPAQGWTDRTGPTSPGTSYPTSMAFDQVGGLTILVKPNAQGTAYETWSWDGAAWASLGGAPMRLSGLVWHEPSQQVVGVSCTTPQTAPITYSLHAWTGSGWSSALGSATLPSNALGLTVVRGAFDPNRQEIVFRTPGANLPSVLVFDGSSLFVRQMASAPAFTSAPEDLAWDPASQKVVMARSESYPALIGSTWMNLPIVRFYEWSGYGWNIRIPSVSPGNMGAMATDTLRQRIVLLDGDYPGSQTMGGNQPHHTWTFGSGVATQLSTQVAPVARVYTAMAFDSQRGVIVLFGGTAGALGTLADTWEFDLGPVASFTAYGSGCPGSRGVPQVSAPLGSLPRIGTTFNVQVSNLPLTGPAFLGIGLSDTSYGGSPLPLDLSSVGAPGCHLLQSLDVLLPLANVLGSANWSFTVPAIPGGEFFVQAFPFDPPASAFGYTASNAGKAVLGL